MFGSSSCLVLDEHTALNGRESNTVDQLEDRPPLTKPVVPRHEVEAKVMLGGLQRGEACRVTAEADIIASH